MKLILITIVCLMVGCGAPEEKENNVDSNPGECTNAAPKCEALYFEAECDPEFSDCVEVVTGTGECEQRVTCQEEFEEGCNNVFVSCPDGYEESFDEMCTPGVGTCIEGLSGVCTQSGSCDCTQCFDFEVESCDGLENCDEVPSCDETKFCAWCPDWTCGDRESAVSVCSPGTTCREESCPSAPELTYFCRPAFECNQSPNCPAGTETCEVESATCVMTKTCGTTLLCEAL